MEIPGLKLIPTVYMEFLYEDDADVLMVTMATEVAGEEAQRLET